MEELKSNQYAPALTKEVEIILCSFTEETIKKTDIVIQEYDLSVYINEKLMFKLTCTPLDLKELVVGYLFSEGLISSLGDIIDFKLDATNHRACLTLTEDCFGINDACDEVQTAKGQYKNIECFSKLCRREMAVMDPVVLERRIVKNLSEIFAKPSTIFEETGAVHRGIIYINESSYYCFDDIGRHNALDKAIGKALLMNTNLSECYLFTSGRIPVDMVRKAIYSGVPVLASRTAPTAKSVEMSKKYGLTLIGFVKQNRFTVYNSK